MPHTPKLLAFAGSTREGSYNKRLLRIAADGARDAGAELTLIDIRDYPMPLFNQDFEAREGPPEATLRLKELMKSCDGFLIASPEYNSSITPLMKNTLDWASRAAPGEPPLAAFTGKVAALMSASPGALGGLRGLVHLRAILGNLGVLVLPGQVAVPNAAEAFDADGQLKDVKRQAAVRKLGDELARVTARLFG